MSGEGVATERRKAEFKVEVKSGGRAILSC